jgi:hypothetical protein
MSFDQRWHLLPGLRIELGFPTTSVRKGSGGPRLPLATKQIANGGRANPKEVAHFLLSVPATFIHLDDSLPEII